VSPACWELGRELPALRPFFPAHLKEIVMRKALSVLALTGGTTTVALAADVPATTPHQLSPDPPSHR